jgi:hypothetical protein
VYGFERALPGWFTLYHATMFIRQVESEVVQRLMIVEQYK